jgi:hypothetical protein
VAHRQQPTSPQSLSKVPLLNDSSVPTRLPLTDGKTVEIVPNHQSRRLTLASQPCWM